MECWLTLAGWRGGRNPRSFPLAPHPRVTRRSRLLLREIGYPSARGCAGGFTAPRAAPRPASCGQPAASLPSVRAGIRRGEGVTPRACWGDGSTTVSPSRPGRRGWSGGPVGRAERGTLLESLPGTPLPAAVAAGALALSASRVHRPGAAHLRAKGRRVAFLHLYRHMAGWEDLVGWVGPLHRPVVVIRLAAAAVAVMVVVVLARSFVSGGHRRRNAFVQPRRGIVRDLATRSRRGAGVPSERKSPPSRPS